MELKNPIKVNAPFETAFARQFSDLSLIHQEDKNVVILQRKISHDFDIEIKQIMEASLYFRSSGDISSILEALKKAFSAKHISGSALFKDIRQLLNQFARVSEASSFRLGFFVVDSNMCRRFHTDINDLRLLCTYKGQGTFWLPEEAANRKEHHNGGDNENIVKEPTLIQQTQVGDVMILKGALYPDAKAAIHRSPSIEESNEKRLLLRIDTNEFDDFN
tara:strand:+ start:8455 stop:9111 length:657 start_codon:yes stop_codon:yes gene_type:complete